MKQNLRNISDTLVQTEFPYSFLEKLGQVEVASMASCTSVTWLNENVAQNTHRQPAHAWMDECSIVYGYQLKESAEGTSLFSS